MGTVTKLPTRPRRAAGMSERQLTQAVVELASRLGWRVHHTADSRSLRTHHPGLPDLLMVKDGRMVAAELKVAGRKPTGPQLDWLEALAGVPGVDAHLWTDTLWLDGTIERVLR